MGARSWERSQKVDIKRASKGYTRSMNRERLEAPKPEQH